MILFYSDSCQHCSVLLDTIKRHDTKKTIKLVCIDTIIPVIKNKINKVPALMFLPTKEIIYGKAVFDYLLLPNRGYLFSSNSTRDKSDTNQTSINAPVPLNKEESPNEPMAFSLGSIMSDRFSDINDNNVNSTNLNKDRVYGWDLIDNTNITDIPVNNKVNIENNIAEKDYKTDKKLPSLEELTKDRENLFKDIK